MTYRETILLGIGVSQGISLGHLLSLALDISGGGIIFTAFAGASNAWLLLLAVCCMIFESHYIWHLKAGCLICFSIVTEALYEIMMEPCATLFLLKQHSNVYPCCPVTGICCIHGLSDML